MRPPQAIHLSSSPSETPRAPYWMFEPVNRGRNFSGKVLPHGMLRVPHPVTMGLCSHQELHRLGHHRGKHTAVHADSFRAPYWPVSAAFAPADATLYHSTLLADRKHTSTSAPE
jgi:hypothetical protein